MGIFGIGTILAPALGPTLGGILIDNFGWRYVFFVAVPFSIITIPLAMIFMPDRDKTKTDIPKFDWAGFLLASIFLSTLLAALSSGVREGWQSDYIISLFAVALFSFVLFIWWENTVKNPILELKIFLYGRFLAAAIVTLIVGFGLYGSTYLLPLFLQTLQGLSLIHI